MIENEDSAPPPQFSLSTARFSLQKAAAAAAASARSACEEELDSLRDFETLVSNTLPLHPLYPASKSRGERDILELEFYLPDTRKRVSEIQGKHPSLSRSCHHHTGGPTNHVKRSFEASSPEIPNHHRTQFGGIRGGSHVKLRSFASSNELQNLKPSKKRINLSPPHSHSNASSPSPHIPGTARTRSRSPPAYATKAGLYLNEKRSHTTRPRSGSCSCSPSGGTTQSETSTNSDQSTSFRNFKRSMSLNEATSNKYIDKIAHKRNLPSPGCEYPQISSAAEMENEIAAEMGGDHLRGKVLYVVDDDESNPCPLDSLSGDSVALNLWPLMPSPRKQVDDYNDDDDDDDLNFPLLPPGTSKQKEKEREKTKLKEKTEVEARFSGENGCKSMVLPGGPIRQLKSQVEHEPGFASSLQIPASSSDDDCASWIAAATCGFKTNSEENHVSLEEEEGIFSMDEGRDTNYALSHPKIGNTRACPFPQVHVQRRSSPSLRSFSSHAKRQEEEEEAEADVNALQNRFQDLFYSNEENDLYDAKSVKKLKKVDVKDSLKLSENMEKTLECLESSLHDSEGGESLYQEVMNVERRLALKTSSYSFPPEVPSKDIIEEMLKEDIATQRYVSSCAVTSGSRRELFTNDDDGNDGNGDGAKSMHQYYPSSCQNESQIGLPLQHLEGSDYDEVRASERSSKARLWQGKEIQAEPLRYDLKLKKKVKFNEGSWNLAKNVELNNHPERSSTSNPPDDQVRSEAGEAEGMNTTFSSFESECDQLGKLQVKDFVDKDIDRYTRRHRDGDVDENVDEPCKKQGLTISRNSFSQDAMSDSSLSSSASCGAKGEPCNNKKGFRSLSDSLGKLSPPASDSSLIATSKHRPFKFLSHEFYHNMGASSNSKEMTFCNPVFDYDSTLNHQLPDCDNFSRPMFNSRNADDEFKSTVGSTNFLVQGHIDSWFSNNLQTKIKQQVDEAVAESMRKFEESIKMDVGNLKKDIELDLKEMMAREKICDRAEAEINLILEGKLEKHFSLLMETACAGKEKVISEMQSELSALHREGEGVRAKTLAHMETMMNLVEEVKSRLDKESMRCKDDEAFKEELETIRKDGMNCRCILDGLKKETEAQMSDIRLAIDKIDTEGVMQCKEQIGGMQSFEKLLYKEYMDVKKVTKCLEKSWEESHSGIEKNRLNILKLEKELNDRIDDLEKLWKDAHFNTENDLKNRVGDLQKSCKQGEYDVESLKEFIADVKKGRSIWNRDAELKHVVQTLEKSFKQGFSDLEALKKFKDDIEKGRRSFLNSEVATRQGTLIMERVESLSQLYLGGLDEVRTQIQDLKSQVQARFNELERHVKVSKQKREESMQTTSPQSLQARILELQQGHIFTQSLEDKLEDINKKKGGKLQDGLNFDKEISSVQLEVMKMCEDIHREKEAALGVATTAKKKINKVVQEFENELQRLHITQSKAEKETDSIRHLSEEISSFAMKAKYVLHDMTELRQKTVRISDEVLSELTQTKWKNASTNHRCDDMYKKVLSLEGSQLDLSSKLDEFLDKMEGLEKSVAEWVPKYDAAARVLNEVENRLGMLETSSTHDVNIEKRFSELVDKDPFVSYYKHMSTKINSDEIRWSPLEANRSLTNLDTREKGVGMSVDTRIIIVESRIEHVASATYTNLRILDTKVQHINGNVETALKCATMAEKKCKILGAELVKVFRMLANSAKPYPGKRHVSPSRGGGGGGGDSEYHHHLPKTEAFRIRKKSPLSRVQLSQKKHLPIVENKHSDGRSIKLSEKNDDRNRVALNKNEPFGTNSSTRKFTTPKAGANSQPCSMSVQGNSVEARSNKKVYNVASRNVNVLDSEDSWPASESISVKLKHRDQVLSKACVGSSAASNPESSNSHSSPVKNSQRTDFHMVSRRIHVNVSQRSRLLT